jgi:hypothetical protein
MDDLKRDDSADVGQSSAIPGVERIEVYPIQSPASYPSRDNLSEGVLDDAKGKTEKLFDAIYTRFVLRDFIGRVIPGAIVIFGTNAAISGVENFAMLLPSLNKNQMIFLILASWLLTTVFIQPLGHFTYFARYNWNASIMFSDMQQMTRRLNMNVLLS